MLLWLPFGNAVIVICALVCGGIVAATIFKLSKDARDEIIEDNHERGGDLEG